MTSRRDSGTASERTAGVAETAASAEPTGGQRRDDTVDAVATAVQDALHHHLGRVDELLKAAGHEVRSPRVPAWLRPTLGEARWPVTIAVLVAIALQFVLPGRLEAGPRLLMPGLELVLLVLLFAFNPRRIDRDHPAIRVASLTLLAVASLANMWSATRLVTGLVQPGAGETARGLLMYGGAVWATNVMVFALWYWEFDRGGAVARAKAVNPRPDFLFPQMQSADPVHEQWEPTFVDYLYVSFTNAAAFSPTDTMPLSRWAKLAMLAQSCVSLVTLALVIARAINVLG